MVVVVRFRGSPVYALASRRVEPMPAPRVSTGRVAGARDPEAAPASTVRPGGKMKRGTWRAALLIGGLRGPRVGAARSGGRGARAHPGAPLERGRRLLRVRGEGPG